MQEKHPKNPKCEVKGIKRVIGKGEGEVKGIHPHFWESENGTALIEMDKRQLETDLGIK